MTTLTTLTVSPVKYQTGQSGQGGHTGYGSGRIWIAQITPDPSGDDNRKPSNSVSAGWDICR